MFFKSPPAPPVPAVESPFETAFEEHPWLTIAIVLLILLKLYAKFGGPKPGHWEKPSPEEYASYEPGVRSTVTDVTAAKKINLARTGLAAMKPITLPQLFASAAKNCASHPALEVERSGQWLSWTWEQYYQQSVNAAASLIKLGISPHECVNIIGFNSPEWYIAQMGAIMCGGVAAGVYTTNEPAACKYIADHSEAKVIFLDDKSQLKKYEQFASSIPGLKAIVMWLEEPGEQTVKNTKIPLYSWKDFLNLSKDQSSLTDQVHARSAAIDAGQCATLIYTSGTTGNPKAVMVSHDNLVYECYVVYSALMSQLDFPDQIRIVSYLPLSHVAGQMLDIIGPILVAGAGFDVVSDPIFRRFYYTVYFARPDALKGTLKLTLLHAKPVVFLGVPRVWEKFMEAMLEVGRKNSPLKQKIAGWAKRHSGAAAKARQLGGDGARTISYLIARKVILSKVRAAIGLDKCVCCLTGAAPMPREVMDYFGQLDLDIYDIYGMSESSGGTTFNTPSVHQAGTVGHPIGPAELKIIHVPGRDKPSEGEICYRGRHIMMGYMKDEAKTREAIDDDGWLHSGDVGMIDSDNLLHITGRIKELIISAGGENIAPVPIEEKLKELCPAISNVMMVGDKRKYNVCVVTVKTEIDVATGMSTGKLIGAAVGISNATTSDQVAQEAKDPSSTWHKYLKDGLSTLNAKHAVSNAQKIQKFTVVPGDFSEKGGELTATLKLRRAPATQKYAKEIDAMY